MTSPITSKLTRGLTFPLTAALGSLMGEASIPAWLLTPRSLVDLSFTGGQYWDGSVNTLGNIATTARAGSNAYSLDSSNVFTLFSANAPRITNLGAWIENAATNLVRRNQDLTSGSWTKPNAPVTAAQTSPDPSNALANLLGDGAATAVHIGTGAAVPFTSGTTSWFCTLVQKLTDSRIQLQAPSTAFGVNAFANFNLGTGAVGTVGSAVTASGIIDFSSVGFPNLYLCYFAAPATASVSAADIVLCRITADNSIRNQSYAGTSTNVLIWLPGCYANFMPRSPILNTANADGVRAADNITITGAAALSGLAAAKSLYAEISGCVFNGTANVIFNWGNMLLQAISTTQIRLTDGTNTVTCTIGGGGTISGTVKIACSFTGSAISIVANNGTPATAAAAWVAPSGTPQLGNRSALDQSLQGFFRRFGLSATASDFDGLTV